MHLRTLVVLAVALVCTTATVASAQTPVSFGGQLNYADDFDLGIGARAVMGTGEFVENTRAMASFDFYFPDDAGSADVSFWEININGHYMIPIENSPVGVYAGGGLHIYNVSVDFDESEFGPFADSIDNDDSGVGLNILGGVDFDAGPSVTPFAELKIELGGAEQFILTGGARF
ncbi:MAG TPA: hypothetical protein VKA86_03660 [Candidatus Krumholzibacteria bacterium]|nr:hypothetical protein [Candidatus Krumholzibacteria bacterium]